MTCFPTSMHWPCFPPQDHINTSRLCSAGSELPTSSPTSMLLCSSPRGTFGSDALATASAATSSPPSAMTSVPLASGLPRGAGACSADSLGRQHVRLQTRQFRRWNTGSPLDRISRGEARTSQVTGPSSSYVPWCNTSPDSTPPGPLLDEKFSGKNRHRLHEKQNARHPE